jgi:hypothetical protein
MLVSFWKSSLNYSSRKLYYPSDYLQDIDRIHTVIVDSYLETITYIGCAI